MLVITSVIAVLICLAITFFLHTAATPVDPRFFLVQALLLALVVGAAFFTIRGYAVTPGAILVQRLFWTTRLPLEDLESAEFRAHAMRGSIRTWGNAGLFSITGWYFSRSLGSYRAFVTNPSNIVVLRYSKRTVLVSPENPESFVSEVLASKAAH